MSEVFTPECPAKERLAFEVQAALRRALREIPYLDVEDIVYAALARAKPRETIRQDSGWIMQERALRTDPDPE